MRLDCGIDFGPVTIAYQTYGTLNAERSNAILICHALTGDQYAADPHPITGKPGWWETMVGPGRVLDTERYFLICANVLGGCMGTTGPQDVQPGNRRAVGSRISGHHRARHGAGAKVPDRTSRHRQLVLRDRRLDGRDAGAAMGGELSRMCFLGGADRRRCPPLGAEHRVSRSRTPGDHGRSGLVRRATI